MMVVVGVGGGQKISSVHTEFEDPVAHPIIAIKTGVWREIGHTDSNLIHKTLEVHFARVVWWSIRGRA